MKTKRIQILRKFRADFLNFKEAYRSPGTLVIIFLLEIVFLLILAALSRLILWAGNLMLIAPWWQQ